MFLNYVSSGTMFRHMWWCWEHHNLINFFSSISPAIILIKWWCNRDRVTLILRPLSHYFGIDESICTYARCHKHSEESRKHSRRSPKSKKDLLAWLERGPDPQREDKINIHASRRCNIRRGNICLVSYFRRSSRKNLCIFRVPIICF